tara:strand:- start:2823 stop:3695 length:873 start_codon:yes stop_codon:yes gene_type:complete
MRKIIILIPVFNDWESLKKLIKEINDITKKIKKTSISCLVINDASTIKQPKLIKPKNIKFLKILNMKKNKGHARCNAFGIRYVHMSEKFDNLILMDGDGEDRPIEIKKLINKIFSSPSQSVVAKRVKRSEGPFFQLLYIIHKLLTYIFTGKKINFGNYSCLTVNDVKILSTKSSLWSSYSGTVKKYLKNFNEIESIRGLRYFGPSKMSLFKLLIHSFSIIAVFKYTVLLRSIILILAISFLNNIFFIKFPFLFIILALFNLIIFVVSFRESKDDLLNSKDNLKNVVKITH